MDELEQRLRSQLATIDHVPVTDADVVLRAAVGRHRARERRRRAGLAASSAVLVSAVLVTLLVTRARPTTDAIPALTTPAAAPASTSTVVATTSVATTVPAGAGSWRPIPADPRGPIYHSWVVWTGKEAIVAGGTSGIDPATPVATVAAYDPATQSWRSLPDLPDGGRRSSPLVAWAGSTMLVIGGDSAEGGLSVNHGFAYTPTTDRWVQFAEQTQGIVTARSPWAWTGHELLVWSGYGPGQAATSVGIGPDAYDPATDTWRRLPAPPIEPRQLAASVWTGREWIVWGGRTADRGAPGHELANGAAYDPSTDTWRTIAPAPLAARRTHAAWTGTEMLVTAGASGGDPVTFDGMFAWSDGAAYDPTTDSWRPLRDGPAHPGFVPVWTGRQLLLFAKVGVTIFDPSANRWVDGSAEPGEINVDGVPVWTGTTALVFGSTNPTLAGAAFTP